MDGQNISLLEVQLSFQGRADGETKVRLPNEWGGQNELFLGLRNLTAEGAEVLPGDGPSQRILRHTPRASITLKYQVVDDIKGPKYNGRGNDYRVRIRDGLLFALGDSFVVQPESVSDETDVTADLVFPDGVSWASDLQHQQMGRRMAFGDLRESVLIAGDIRVVDAGGGARLAIFGGLASRDDTGWRESFQRISRAQREYWKAEDEPFLVTIVTSAPAGPGSISLGGTGRSDAFAFFATNNAEPHKLDQVMAHEMMHTWVPRRIGGLRRTPPEQADYWLSEGFTNWAAWRVLVRSGFWKPEDFVRAFNENIKDYDLSPVREAPNTRIVADFWNDRSSGDLPYRRGMLLATYWDSRVLRATQGKHDFDDVLLHMQKLSKSKPEASAVQLLLIAMQEVAGVDIQSDLDRYVELGQPVDLMEDTFTENCKIRWVERPIFHRGFDAEATQRNGGIISGVVEGCPAWKAGLRNGMQVVARRSGEIGNSQVEVIYEVKANGVPLILKWLPKGISKERYRMLQLSDTLSSRQSVIARLGGTSPNEK